MASGSRMICARAQMVLEQLQPRGIQDERVLRVMAEMPRERFVPPELATAAYVDGPLPIGHDQTISQPYMVACMAELLALTGTERVLEVGAGSGYAAAVLSRLAREVVAVESIPALLDEAKARWASLGLDNITGILGDGSLGVSALAPFDAISVAAGAPRIPPALVAQLCPGVGRMVIPVGTRYTQTLTLVRRGSGGETRIEPRFLCAFVPLLGREGWSERAQQGTES